MSPPSSVSPRALELAPPTRVACRARAWRVLDCRRVDGTTAWRLARGAEMPRLIASPPDHVVGIPEGVRRVSRRAWARGVVMRRQSATPIWWPSSAVHLPIDKVPWQLIVSMMILSGHHRRVLLADDVGMGKTVQASLLLHEVHAREPDASTLVIVPAGLVSQWAKELRSRAGLEALVLDAAALRAEAAAPRRVVDASRAGSCWLISIDLLRQPDVITLLARTPWTLLVVDEAHVCAPGSARLDAVSRVALSSARVLLLTACPTASGPNGAERLRDIGRRRDEAPMPIVRRSASRLASTPRRARVMRVALDHDHLELCTRLDRFVERAFRETGTAGLLPALVLRRRAAACPVALVRSLERRLVVLGTAPQPTPSLVGLFDAEMEASEDEHALHVRAWRSDRDERAELEQLLQRARRLPDAGARLAAVARLVRRYAEPVVIFTTYLDSLRALHPLLTALPTIVIHGEQPMALREAAIEAFTRGEAMVLLTTDASAEGLNLHHRCRLVVHAEVPRSRRTLEQRNGRVDRYGQTRRVHAVVIASRTTEDDQALQRLSQRAAEDEAWMAAQPERCRRTEVAAKALGVWSGRPLDGVTPRSSGGDGLTLCLLRRRRWHRLASRLGLPATARALCVGAVRAAGGAELSAGRVLTCLAMPTGELMSLTTPSAWPAPMRGIAVRARGLARRLEHWETDALRAAMNEASAHAPSLFSDATAHAVIDEPAAPCRALSVTFEPVAMAMPCDAGAPAMRVAPTEAWRAAPITEASS